MKSSTFAIESKKRENNDLLVSRLTSSLLEHGFVYEKENPELIFVFGGDGSLMRAVHLYGKKGKFILINTGHLGFYSDYDHEEMDQFLLDFYKNEPIEEKIPFYQIEVDGKRHEFINDVALQSGETVFIDVLIDDELLTTVRANGIVISSPIGTTGYLTSLASPIVIGKPKIYQYSTIAPCYNRLSINPINKAIIDNDKKLTVVVKEGFIETYLDGIYREDLKGRTFSFKGNDEHTVTLLHYRDISQVKRLRKNISGMED